VPLMITENTSIDYDVYGEGPPLILIGGLGFGRWSWFKQVPALSRHFKTISFDARGERHLSDGVPDLASDVVALLEHLNVKKAHVLGTSLGGFVAEELALKRPDLVNQLVLVCTSYGSKGLETISPWALSDMIGLPSYKRREGCPPRARDGHLRGLPRGASRGVRADSSLAPGGFAGFISLLPADESRCPLRRLPRHRAHSLPYAGDPRG
jgi:pimeloyl-ACP methyl ester carboxylesterase